MSENYPCPICDYLFNFEPDNSQEICPSCGVQFGYSDHVGGDTEKRKQLYQAWRKAWIENGQKPLDKDQERKLIAEVSNKDKENAR